MIVYSKIENDVVHSKEVIPITVYSNVIDNTIYSNEVDYASISEIIRLLENGEARSTEDYLTRLLE